MPITLEVSKSVTIPAGSYAHESFKFTNRPSGYLLAGILAVVIDGGGSYLTQTYCAWWERRDGETAVCLFRSTHTSSLTNTVHVIGLFLHT